MCNQPAVMRQKLRGRRVHPGKDEAALPDGWAAAHAAHLGARGALSALLAEGLC
jgi:predicted nucleic acid-binding protein